MLFYSHLGERSKGNLRALALFRGGLLVTGERVKSGFMLPEVFKGTAPIRLERAREVAGLPVFALAFFHAVGSEHCDGRSCVYFIAKT